MTAVPDAGNVAQYLGIAEDAPQLAGALAAEIAAQASRCRVDTYTDDLAEALRRRVARNLAMKNVPLGVAMEEFGATQLGSYDPEVRRLEAPYRRTPIG